MQCGKLGALGGDGSFMLAAAAFEQTLTTGLHALGFRLSQELGVNLRPFLHPTVTTDWLRGANVGLATCFHPPFCSIR